MRLTCEDRLTAEVDQSCPVLLAGQGACLPGDFGGTTSYANLKQILANPRHPKPPTVRFMTGSVPD
ncbi:plasmid pRiA4b ORF-3 family protein (plasmid) [Streptomyces sp. NBC_00445]|uniref:IS1096 element passenger TnpR family protein n=1 Tax=Streptomyces sp. NBC_00445 TaxID=2975745 RepID=UPI002E24A7AE